MSKTYRPYIRLTQIVLRAVGRLFALVTRGRTTVYSRDTAMHGAVMVSTQRWGLVTFMPACHYAGWHIYASPNGTPWASTWGIGPGYMHDSPDGRKMARVRRELWDHNYDCERLDPQLLDLALLVVESRHRPWLMQIIRMFDDRAGWLDDADAGGS